MVIALLLVIAGNALAAMYWKGESLRLGAGAASSEPVGSPKLANAGGDFTADLLARMPIVRTIVAAKKAAHDMRIALRGVSSELVVMGTLPSADLVFELRGAYPAFKLWLNDVAGQVPGLAIVGLELRRSHEATALEANVAASLDATVRLRVHARPASAPDSLPRP